jgi:hypothetical protein
MILILSVCSKIKHRRRTAPHQLEVLDGLFKQCPKPDMDVRKKLAGELGMTVREVQVWVGLSLMSP